MRHQFGHPSLSLSRLWLDMPVARSCRLYDSSFEQPPTAPCDEGSCV